MAQFEIIALDTGTTDQLRAPGVGDSYIANRAVAIAVGALTTDIKAFDVSATWNNAAVTFTGMKFNVTDTASNAASLLADLQVGGSSKYSFRKDGRLTINYATSDRAITAAGNGDGFVATVFSTVNAYGPYGIRLGNDSNLQWGSTSNGLGTIAVSLGTDLISNTLAQRNGTNAQTFRLYGTYTDASNYRRLVKTMSTSGVAELKVEGAGTGSSGNVLHISGLPTSNPGPGILWNNAGTPAIGT